MARGELLNSQLELLIEQLSVRNQYGTEAAWRQWIDGLAGWPPPGQSVPPASVESTATLPDVDEGGKTPYSADPDWQMFLREMRRIKGRRTKDDKLPTNQQALARARNAFKKAGVMFSDKIEARLNDLTTRLEDPADLAARRKIGSWLKADANYDPEKWRHRRPSG